MLKNTDQTKIESQGYLIEGIKEFKHHLQSTSHLIYCKDVRLKRSNYYSMSWCDNSNNKWIVVWECRLKTSYSVYSNILPPILLQLTSPPSKSVQSRVMLPPCLLIKYLVLWATMAGSSTVRRTCRLETTSSSCNTWYHK